MKKVFLSFLFNIFVVLASFSQNSDFTGTYYNGKTTKQIDLSGPLYVKPQTFVRVESPKLRDATLTYSGSPGATYTLYNHLLGILEFGAPSMGSVVVNVVCSDGTSYYLPFIVTNNLNLLNSEETDKPVVIAE